MRTPLPIRITAACLLVTMSACTTWQTYTVTRDQQELPPRIRVTLDTGVRATLHRAELRGDTLAGWTTRGHPDGGPQELMKVPLPSLQVIEREVFSPGRTFLAVVGTGAVIVGAAILLVVLEYEY